jgi:hypothetical protein
MNMRQKRLNGWWRSALMPLLLLAVLMLVLAGSLVFRGTAHAQNGFTGTVTVASPMKLIARTTLKVSGTVSCTLPGDVANLQASGGTVDVSQASGRQIVKAEGVFFPLNCDGTAHTFQAFLTPPAGSAPFHGGSAIATISLSAIWQDTSGNFFDDTVNTGPLTIKISG